MSSVILLHGALGSSEQFDPLVDLLPSDLETYTFNFSGHGGMEITGPFSIERFVQDTIGFMDTKGIKQGSFFGYSMGGYIALQMARDYPERVDKIMTLGTMLRWNPDTAAREVRKMDPEIIAQKIPVFASLLQKRHASVDWKKVMRETAMMMTALGSGYAMRPDDFQRISAEVMLCIGDQDNMVSIEETSEIADQLPHGFMNILHDVKHPLESIEPLRLTDLIRRFF